MLDSGNRIPARLMTVNTTPSVQSANEVSTWTLASAHRAHAHSHPPKSFSNDRIMLSRNPFTTSCSYLQSKNSPCDYAMKEAGGGETTGNVVVGTGGPRRGRICPKSHAFISINNSIIDYELLCPSASSKTINPASPGVAPDTMEHPRSDVALADSLPTTEQDATTSCAIAGIRRWFDAITPRLFSVKRARTNKTQKVPTISTERRAASLADQPFPFGQIEQIASKTEPSSEETVLYLGYGSNMSAETFRGRRNIQPISQMNALVPELALTFDLPGVPYSEPCFANTRYRHPVEGSEKNVLHPPYHKDQWSKGLVGIVYEITKADFAHVIATEGGGASYQDILVDCYALEEDAREKVPMEPRGAPFKAHTLFSPPGFSRPDPSYAQPSPRYLKLIIDGAEEHNLPYEYQEYLNSIGTYTPTTIKQRLGQFIFLSLWSPVFAFIFGGASLFLDKDGRYPKWYANFAMATFAACWGSYDDIFKHIFGDGERTIEDGKGADSGVYEKESLIRYHTKDYGAVASLEWL